MTEIPPEVRRFARVAWRVFTAALLWFCARHSGLFADEVLAGPAWWLLAAGAFFAVFLIFANDDQERATLREDKAILKERLDEALTDRTLDRQELAKVRPLGASVRRRTPPVQQLPPPVRSELVKIIRPLDDNEWPNPPTAPIASVRVGPPVDQSCETVAVPVTEDPS